DSQTTEIVAKALYRRGIAYRESGRNAQAAADFTAALWLKALPASDEEEARKSRSASYAALGVADRSGSDIVAGGGASSNVVASAFETTVQSAPAEAPKVPAIGSFETSVQASAPEPKREPKPERAPAPAPVQEAPVTTASVEK